MPLSPGCTYVGTFSGPGQYSATLHCGNVSFGFGPMIGRSIFRAGITTRVATARAGDGEGDGEDDVDGVCADGGAPADRGGPLGPAGVGAGPPVAAPNGMT